MTTKIRTDRRRLPRVAMAAMLLSALIVLVSPGGPAHATLTPATGTFTVSPGASVTETKTVGVPASPPKADIEIAIDTTGSMGGAIAEAKSEATKLVDAVKAEIPDAQFAVVDFKDASDGPTAEYQVRAPMTGSAATVQAAINAMSATGGGDFPEAYNLVFDKAGSPLTGGDLGWRSGSRKFVVVIGDAPPHGATPAGYPACSDSTADPHGLNSATELTELAGAQRTLFMVATNTGIKSCYDQLVVGGFSGSASVLLGSSISDQIVALIDSASSTVSDVHLAVASAGPAPAAASWVSFNPASVGPVSTPSTHTFTLTAAVPLGTPAGTYTFDIVALADGADIGHQTLTLVVEDDRDGTFACRGSALRLGSTEPAVANAPSSPCKDGQKTVASGGLGTGGLSVGIQAKALTALTDQTPEDLEATTPKATDNGLAKAGLSEVTITVGPAVTIKATVVQSQAKVQCTATAGGLTPKLTGSSTIASLTVNGLPVNVSRPTTVSLAGVTIGINSQTTTATSLTQRALTVSAPLVPAVVVAEASAGFSGRPCG